MFLHCFFLGLISSLQKQQRFESTQNTDRRLTTHVLFVQYSYFAHEHINTRCFKKNRSATIAVSHIYIFPSANCVRLLITIMKSNFCTSFGFMILTVQKVSNYY